MFLQLLICLVAEAPWRSGACSFLAALASIVRARNLHPHIACRADQSIQTRSIERRADQSIQARSIKCRADRSRPALSPYNFSTAGLFFLGTGNNCIQSHCLCLKYLFIRDRHDTAITCPLCNSWDRARLIPTAGNSIQVPPVIGSDPGA